VTIAGRGLVVGGFVAIAAVVVALAQYKPQDSSLGVTTGGVYSSPAPDDPWEHLRRPLASPLPLPCEPARGRAVSAKFAPAIGPGPVYPVGGPELAMYGIAASTKQQGYFPIKILWVAPPTFRDRVLVRGVGSDGSQLRFSESRGSELRIDWTGHAGQDWREWASYTWVDGPGCFQWQVDVGLGSSLVVFEAAQDV
jgi:hypothetical protein